MEIRWKQLVNDACSPIGEPVLQYLRKSETIQTIQDEKDGPYRAFPVVTLEWVDVPTVKVPINNKE